jgi:RNA polymerase sigma factor (sigma-70 family)
MSADAKLWRDFQQGDKQAFEAIFLRYHQELFQYGSKMTRNHQLLDDSIQELFLELWQSRKTLAAVVSIKAYLFRAIKFKLVRAIKKQLRETSLTEDDPELLEFSYEATLIAEQTAIALKQQLLNIIRQLTPRQQEIIYLRYYSHMSYEEIGVIMGISYQAAVNLISKSIKFMREHMVYPS